MRTRSESIHPSTRVLAGLLMAASLVTASCGASGPSTATQVCDEFRALAKEMSEIRVLGDNAVFSAADDLGDVATRFEGSAAVMADGASLNAIADMDETSDDALDRASFAIANLCGKRSLTSYSSRLFLGLED